MSRSKSLMTGAATVGKSLINPVSTNSVQELQFGPAIVNAFNVIQTNYVGLMSNRKYLDINDSVSAYLALFDTMTTALSTQKNTNLKLLMQIATDGMTGALHSKTLSSDNTDLNMQVLLLNKKNDDILSGKNEVTALGNTSGEFVISKTFKLAPLYSYYIYLYGLPAFGVGFETAKLSLVATILTKYGINPYS
jgi:hypothetical protein